MNELDKEIEGLFERIKDNAKKLDDALKLIESDPHLFGTRPCTTCAQVSQLIGRKFGCDNKRG